MSTLALDLGTTTGWAWSAGDSTESMCSGVWRFRADDGRFLELRKGLDTIHTYKALTAVYYELVHRHLGTQAAHVYGGFQGELKSWCALHAVPLVGIGVGTIKKFWTGQGNASKAMMMDECRNRGFNPQDDNEADAIALRFYVKKTLGA